MDKVCGSEMHVHNNDLVSHTKAGGKKKKSVFPHSLGYFLVFCVGFEMELGWKFY